MISREKRIQYLQAMGVTPGSVPINGLYEKMLDARNFDDILGGLVLNKLYTLGYSLPEKLSPINHRNPKVFQAVLTLLGAQYANLQEIADDSVRSALTEEYSRKKTPTGGQALTLAADENMQGFEDMISFLTMPIVERAKLSSGGHNEFLHMVAAFRRTALAAQQIYPKLELDFCHPAYFMILPLLAKDTAEPSAASKTSPRGWSALDCKRFLKALGVTDKNVDANTYHSLMNYPNLADLFRYVVKEKLDHLGFDAEVTEAMQLPLIHPELREAMHRLIEAHTLAYGTGCASIIADYPHNPFMERENLLDALIKTHTEEFGEFLNYAGEYRLKRTKALVNMEETAVNSSHALLATYAAMKTITSICRIPDTTTPHPIITKISRGLITPVTGDREGRAH